MTVSRAKRSNNRCMACHSMSLVAHKIPMLVSGTRGHQHETLYQVAAISFGFDSRVLINTSMNDSDNVKLDTLAGEAMPLILKIVYVVV